jgi:hypothetical protein
MNRACGATFGEGAVTVDGGAVTEVEEVEEAW